MFGWVAACVLALAGGPALAQRPEVKIESVRWGWQGVMPADRFAPVRVLLSSGDKASSGIVQIEFDQDPTQRGRITAQYATTPGLATPVELTAALPISARTARIDVIDLSGRGAQLVATRQLDGAFDGGAEVVSDRAIVPTWGRSSVSRAWLTLAEPGGGARLVPPMNVFSGTFTGQVQTDTNRPVPDSRYRRAQRLMVTPAEEVPGAIGAWSAYDSAELVVVGALGETRVDPRTLDAVRAWVLSGGRLVIIAEPAGEGWRRWLPEGPAFDVVRVGDLTPLPGPGDVRDVLAELRALAEAAPPNPGSTERDELVSAWHKQLRELQAPAFDAAATVRARPVTLTERGKASGWRTRWAAGEAGAIVAEGPIGFGFVTVVGADPELTLGNVSAPGLRAVWESAARTILERDGGWLARPVYPQFSWRGQPTDMFDGEPETARAVWSALDRAVRGQGLRVDVGAGVFFGIAGCVAVLALLLGPIDALVLKRIGARSLAWASALGWIGLASVAGVLIPTLLRSGESSAGRFTETDVLLEPVAGGSAREVSSAAALAWDTSVGTIFAGRPERFALPDEGVARVSRGISAISSAGDRSAFRSFAPHDAVEASVGLDEERARLLGVRTVRGGRATELELGQWMLRSVMDSGPRGGDAGLSAPGDAREGLRAVSRVEDTPDGPTLVVEISGLPASSEVKSAVVRVGPGAGRVVIPEQFFREGSLRLTVRGPVSEVDDIARETLGFGKAPVAEQVGSGQARAEVLPAPWEDESARVAAMSLWGARTRGLSHAVRGASERYAVVMIELANVPMDVMPKAGGGGGMDAQAAEPTGAGAETGALVRRSDTNLRTRRDARVRLSVPIPAEASRVWSGSGR